MNCHLINLTLSSKFTNIFRSFFDWNSEGVSGNKSLKASKYGFDVTRPFNAKTLVFWNKKTLSDTLKKSWTREWCFLKIFTNKSNTLLMSGMESKSSWRLHVSSETYKAYHPNPVWPDETLTSTRCCPDAYMDGTHS